MSRPKGIYDNIYQTNAHIWIIRKIIHRTPLFHATAAQIVKIILIRNTNVAIKSVGLNIFLNCLTGPTINIVDIIIQTLPNEYITANAVNFMKKIQIVPIRENNKPRPQLAIKPYSLCVYDSSKYFPIFHPSSFSPKGFSPDIPERNEFDAEL